MIPFIESERCYYRKVDKNDDGIYDYAEIYEVHSTKNTEIEIPAKLGDLPVLSIGERSFYDPFSYIDLKLKNVKIANGVTSIGKSAFYNSYNMESVTLPNSITYIGDRAFKDCCNLKNITIPSGLTSINNGVFSGCTNLSSITIPKNINNIESDAFIMCSNLKSITIENPDCKIYDSQDTICNGYSGNDSENTYKGIIYGYEGSTAQAYAKKYNYKFSVIGEQPPIQTTPPVTEPPKTTNPPVTTDPPVSTAPPISGDLSKATQTKPISTTIKDSVNYEYSYTEIDNKQGIKIEACIGETKELEIPNEINGKPVIALGPSALSSCTNAESITIPENVIRITIGSSSFRCPNLKSIIVSENNKNYSSADGILFNKDKTILIRFPAGSLLKVFEIPKSVNDIYFSAFCDCANLTNIVIPDNVTFIQDCAFLNCTNLKNITIENPDCKIADLPTTIKNDNQGYNGIIYGYEGSIAQEYAKKCGYKFKTINAGELNISDLISMQIFLVDVKSEYSKKYDLNNDGVNNIFDLMIIKKRILNS